MRGTKMKLVKVLAIGLLGCAGAVEAATVYPGKKMGD
jgi:hypothetical protein